MTIKSKLKYLAASILAVLLTSGTAFASLTSESRAALSQLESRNSAAAKVSSRALAMLVFPNVVKAPGLFLARKAAKAPCSFMEGHPGATGRWQARMDYKPVFRSMVTRALLHEPESSRLDKQYPGMGDWDRSKCRAC